MENNRGLHLNYSVITDFVNSGAKVLDLGCGDGTLLKMLFDEKHVSAKGIELHQENVIKSIENGVCTIQGNIDEGLLQFSDKEYDFVILNRTLQSTEKPDFVIKEMLRVGKKAIVSFPNFGYWKVRFNLLLGGKMPKSKMLPFEWYDTPNIHLLTISDFFDFLQANEIKLLEAIYLNHSKIKRSFLVNNFANFFAEEAIFVLTK